MDWLFYFDEHGKRKVRGRWFYLTAFLLYVLMVWVTY